MSFFKEPEENEDFEYVHRYVLNITAVGRATVEGTESETCEELLSKVDEKEIEWDDIDAHGKEIIEMNIKQIEIIDPFTRPWERPMPRTQKSILEF